MKRELHDRCSHFAMAQKLRRVPLSPLLYLGHQMYAGLTGRQWVVGFQYLAVNVPAPETLKGFMPVTLKRESARAIQSKGLIA